MAFARCLAALVLLCGASGAFGEEVRTSTVSYRSGPEQVGAFLAEPEGEGRHPAMIVIHEWWGLNDRIKAVATTFAERGYVALAVDLYRGRVTDDPEEAHELHRGLPEDRALADLIQALAYLRGLPNVRKEHVGVIGWCMGGGYALSLAVGSDDLAACVVYYGRLITNRAALKRIAAPVIGFFGEEDRGIPAASVKTFEQAMRELGKTASVHIYPNAGHAFALRGSPSYREAPAGDAWEKTWRFLATHLKR